MNRKSRAPVPEAIAQLQRQLEQFRSSQPGRRKLPESLWQTVEAEKLPALQLYGMACPSCRAGTCVVTNLSRKYEALLKQVSPELLLPETELGILQTLDAEQRSMKAAEIAAELDTSYQMIGKRGKLLDEKGLVRRFEVDKRRAFEITELARQSYFSDRSEPLDLSSGDDADTPGEGE